MRTILQMTIWILQLTRQAVAAAADVIVTFLSRSQQNKIQTGILYNIAYELHASYMQLACKLRASSQQNRTKRRIFATLYAINNATCKSSCT